MSIYWTTDSRLSSLLGYYRNDPKQREVLPEVNSLLTSIDSTEKSQEIRL